MRRSGRTTKILLKLMTYISENWHERKTVILTAESCSYAWILARRVMDFLPPDTKQPAIRIGNSITFGKVQVIVMAYETYSASPMHGVEIAAEFHDHLFGEGHYYEFQV